MKGSKEITKKKRQKEAALSEREESLRVITAVISESRTIIALIGIIFGFLLNVSVSLTLLDVTEKMLLIASLVFSIITVGVFSLPVIYHHLEFPYRDPEKFALRYHWFMSIGFVPFLLTFFFAACFALHRLLGNVAFVITVILFIIVGIVYALRRVSRRLVHK